MIQGKNLKLKLGLCGLALTSFLALNARSNTVHADTVSGNNANAITWDSDQDDSQVVKEDSNQSQPTQSAQGQAPATQSVQSSVQNRAETSAVRVSNFDTSTVNRLNANTVRNNQVKVATVHDTAQMPVQKTKVAQFNQGSKIYTLNGSNQLSKSNGDGYVITNAGTYNGRAVDIGVTINGVQDNQGTYTTKWSNGDNADVTGKTDASFNYQNSVLAGTQQDDVAVPNQTRQRTANTQVTVDSVPNTYLIGWDKFPATDSNNIYNGSFVISPKLLTDVKAYYNCNINEAVQKILQAYGNFGYDADPWIMNTPELIKVKEQLMRQAANTANEVKPNINGDYADVYGDNTEQGNNRQIHTGAMNIVLDSKNTLDNFKSSVPLHNFDDVFADNAFGSNSPYLYILESKNNTFDPSLSSFELKQLEIPSDNDELNARFSSQNKYTLNKPTQVTDHLQLANKTDASLNYNYTVGLYDAQTGDLITDLKAEYKGETGVQATSSDSVMNNAIKNKIQQINQGQATVSYTGTSANDDVAFYQETRQVNPQDKNVNRQVQRVIHINFPNGVKPASYDSITDSKGNKLTLDSNNNLTQSMSFTRTGTENIVSGQTTYGPWQQHGAINAVTLPDIPGYTMVTTN